MKKLFVVLAAALAFGLSAQAQEVAEKSASDSKQGGLIFAEYNSMNIKHKDASEGANYNGFSVGYFNDNGTFNKQGWAWGVALAFEADFYSKDKASATALSFKMPFKFGYTLGNGNVHFTPYAFFAMQFYISATSSYGSDSKSISYFDKDDMGSSDATWDRFHAPIGLGLNVNIKKLDLGVNYSWHVLGGFGKDINGTVLGINLGYRL